MNNSIPLASFEFLSKESLDPTLKCTLCSEPLEIPWAHIMCDKVFCKKCLEKAKFLCTSCPISQKFEFFEVKASSLLNSLGNLLIICNNCNTSMKRAEFESHIKFCNNTKKLEESNDNKIFGVKEEEPKSNTILSEKPLKRTFHELCDDTKTMDLVNCPLECGKKILLCEESLHYLECSEIKVKCRASSQGCTAFLTRKEMNEHIQDCDFVKLSKFLEEIEPKTAQFLDDILKMEEKNNSKQHYPYISAFVNKVKNNFKHSKKMIIKKMKNYYDSFNNNVKNE